MSGLFKKFKKRIDTIRAGSKPFTGIDAGREGSNTGQTQSQPAPRRPARTPLGPDRQGL